MIILMLVKKRQEINNFTEITHYFIDSEIGNKKMIMIKDSMKFSSVYGHKINFQTLKKADFIRIQ
jgi:hypothetical protein